MFGPGRRFALGAAAVLTACLLASCGASDSASDDAPTLLSWYVGPDLVDAPALAATCNAEAAGAYRIEVEQLPADVSARHDLLVRRLRANDDTMDLLSLDSAFTAELAAAGFLAPVPDDLVGPLSEGIARPALDAATYEDRLVVAPWFLDPQVLWFRGNVAERAGLDTSKPISWDDLIAGAQRLGVTIQVQDRDGSGLAEWVTALVTGAGGTLVSGNRDDAEVGLSGDAGRAAASIVEFYHESEVGPGPSKDALSAFAAPGGGFLVASASAVADPALASVSADMVAAAYPTVTDRSVAPLAGIGLAVPKHAPQPARSYDAIQCLTSPERLTALMTEAQHSASRLSTYDDKSVAAAYPQRTVTRTAVKTGATVPATPYWFQVLGAVDRTWTPTQDVTQDATPDAAQAAVEAAIEGTLR
ncbi:extracellular solute-binding protein [Aeromicrobium chenweiae]|uniref:extracellular solute-binding protein n=1 Tax=Aeromicrobium chenweiae TaxID=2079793 RepID=UPI00131F3A39|nr:extracellular solute-binding protein [Aeromicrobium chenweiae]